MFVDKRGLPDYRAINAATVSVCHDRSPQFGATFVSKNLRSKRVYSGDVLQVLRRARKTLLVDEGNAEAVNQKTRRDSRHPQTNEAESTKN